MTQIKEKKMGFHSTARYVNKQTLKDIARIFQDSKKVFFNTYEKDGYVFKICGGDSYFIEDINGAEIVSFNSDGIVMAEDRTRTQALLDYIDANKYKKELEKQLSENSNSQSSKKLKI